MSIEPCDTALDRGSPAVQRSTEYVGCSAWCCSGVHLCTACDEIGVSRELVQRNICLTFLQQCVFNNILQCNAGGHLCSACTGERRGVRGNWSKVPRAEAGRTREGQESQR